MSHVTVANWRETPIWKNEEKRLRKQIEADQVARQKAESRAKAIALKEYEAETQQSFKRQLMQARDELKKNADSQMQTSTAMTAIARQAIAQLGLQHSQEVIKVCDEGINAARFAREGSIIAKNAMEIYQRVYAIEEILEALQNAQT
ncbi:MAG: hypothetical protein F6J87_06035 [Spirulina sp. SIO3F2]|nr:hypothetical protein [Spirulina sp. SIO3F2]